MPQGGGSVLTLPSGPLASAGMHVPQTVVILRHAGMELARVTLPPGEYIIGRSAEADVRADTPLISRRHARLTLGHDHALLEDLGSSNGTFVGGQPIAERSRLFPSQPVRVGDVQVEIRRERTPGGAGAGLAPAQAIVRRLLPEELLAERRYAIGSVVARGGMGAILDARQAAMQRTVAMKVMLETGDEAAVRRFIGEAQITGQLDHPNIVPIYELGVDEQEQLFYTMKLVRGVTLRKVLGLLAEGDAGAVEKHPLPALLTDFQKVCDAVAFAHSKGVIHRDLKPENIMIGDFGTVLVMDWGLAKLVAGGEAQRSTVNRVRTPEPEFGGTMAGTVMGTPQYMAPEQARGEVETLDARADIYALGAILYHLLALRPSVSGPSAMRIVDKVARGETDPLGGPGTPARLAHIPGGRIPDSLAAVVRKAMALVPEHRYASVAALQADVLAYQTGFATSAEKAGAWKQLTLFVRRNQAVSVAAGAGLVLLVCVSAAFTLRVIGERNAAIAERARAETARETAVLERGRADAALSQTESERRRAEDALTDAQAQRQRAEKALADYKTEQGRADAERGRADAESDRAKKAMGDVQTQSNRAELAMADLKKTAPTFLALARARLADGKYAEAFEQIGYAIRLDEQSADCILFRAEAYQITRRLPEAIADYRRVLAMRPGDRIASANLAICQRLLAENRGAAAGSALRLAGWWKADGNAMDSAGGNHGTLMSGMTFRAGRIGQAFACDGRAAYVSIPWSPALALGSDDFTICLWVSFTEIFGQQAFLASDGSGGKWAFQFIPGHLQLVAQGGTKATVESAYFGPAQGQWYHVAVTRTGGAVHFHVDGAEISSESWAGAMPATSAPLILGHATGRFFLSGMLDDVRLYARCLSPLELREIAGVPAPPATAPGGTSR